MTRCYYCEERIWPWQRFGWEIGRGRWHSACYRKAMRR